MVEVEGLNNENCPQTLHTHTHKHTHTNIYTMIHYDTHVYIHTHTMIHISTCTHYDKRLYTHKHTHYDILQYTCLYTHTSDTHLYTHTEINYDTHVYTYTHMRYDTLWYTCLLTHSVIYYDTCVYTYIHTSYTQSTNYTFKYIFFLGWKRSHVVVVCSKVPEMHTWGPESEAQPHIKAESVHICLCLSSNLSDCYLGRSWKRGSCDQKILPKKNWFSATTKEFQAFKTKSNLQVIIKRSF